MEIIKLIGYINSIIWILIPIRQYKTKFFLFFLVLGLLDPLAFTSIFLIKFNVAILYLFGTIVLFYTASLGIKREIKIGFSLFFLVASLIVVFYSMPISIIIQMVIHLMIFIYFLKILVVFYSEHRKLLLFHLVLVVYEFSLLLKFYVFYHEVGVGPAYYSVTTALQIIIGIFFIFVNEVNSPKLTI